MSNARRGRVCMSLGSLALALQVAGADPVPEAELARCAAVSAPGERLDCYDALAGRARKAATPASTSQHAAPAAASAAAAGATAAAAAPTGAAAVPAAPAVTGTAPGAQASFGLPPPPPVTPGPTKIEARVARMSASSQGATVTLDNGQVWSVQQPDQWLQSGDTVTIRQASLGSYLLTTPTRHSYRARRLQ